MAPPSDAPHRPDESRDAATHTVTGVFLVALSVSVLGGLAFAELGIDRLLIAAAGGALLLCGALFLWRARVHRRRGGLG